MASMTHNNAAKFEAAFRKFAARVEEFGVKVDISGVNHDAAQMKFGVVITAIEKDGKLAMPESERLFRELAPHYGVKPDALGTTFIDHAGRAVKILGLRDSAKASKNVVSVEMRGKIYNGSWNYLRQQMLMDPNAKKFVDEKVKVEPVTRRRRRTLPFYAF